MAGNNTIASKITLTSRSPEETRQLGAIIGRLASPGDVLLLTGKLGAGKTCLTQGIAAGLGTDEGALSSSFVIMREIKGRLPLYHIDLYRLENIGEIADLGLDDYLCGQGLSVVEWAERAPELLPPQHLLIEIEYGEGNRRRLNLIACGQRYQKMANRIENLYREAAS